MVRFTTISKVSETGIVTITLPAEAAGQDVRVTIEPTGLKQPMSQVEWQAYLLSTGGTIPDLERQPQPELEEREPL
ncbi:MAG: hypothetical protein ACRC8S_06955 [Fimbriiglobus sp.]